MKANTSTQRWWSCLLSADELSMKGEKRFIYLVSQNVVKCSLASNGLINFGRTEKSTEILVTRLLSLTPKCFSILIFSVSHAVNFSAMLTDIKIEIVFYANFVCHCGRELSKTRPKLTKLIVINVRRAKLETTCEVFKILLILWEQFRNQEEVFKYLLIQPRLTASLSCLFKLEIC